MRDCGQGVHSLLTNIVSGLRGESLIRQQLGKTFDDIFYLGEGIYSNPARLWARDMVEASRLLYPVGNRENLPLNDIARKKKIK